MKRRPIWAWLVILAGVLYFFVPLYATLDFSLRARRDVLSLDAYTRVFQDPQFLSSFSFSVEMALATIVAGALLVVPTAYWVHLRLPRLRPVVEFVTLLPFVIPAIVLVFGLIRLYSRPPLLLLSSITGANAMLVAGYLVLSLPYLYRAVDTGLRSIDIRTLTEAAQSLGAGWGTIIARVILPNLRVALLSAAFLTFAIVIGEFTLANFLARPAFGPYMVLIGRNKAFEPAALSMVSIALTWMSIGVILWVGRGSQGQGQLGGTK